jgi:pyruvate-ferredoxin/flavodoxin oxidoreductase
VRLGRKAVAAPPPPYPGRLGVVDGRGALAAALAAAGAVRALPPLAAGEDGSAGAIAAGLSLTGLRAVAVAGGAGLAAMHPALAAAAGRRLPLVVHATCRALPRHAPSVHAGHDDYHAVADAGLFQLFASDVQQVADLALVAHRIAELALTPGLLAQDGGLTSHGLAAVRLPDREVARAFLGEPADLIEAPTPAQRLVYGERRRRVPEAFDLDYPAMSGAVQGPEAFPQGVAAQRVFFLDHVAALADRALDEYAALTGRRHARAGMHRVDDADHLIVAQGSVVALAEAVADHLRASRTLRLGVVNVTMFRPFPADLVTAALRGKRGVLVLERVDHPLAADPPLLRELRAVMGQALENGRVRGDPPPHAGVAACAPDEVPAFHAACFGLGGRALGSGDLLAAVTAMIHGGGPRRHVYLGVDFARPGTRLPKLQIWQERLLERYPDLMTRALAPAPAVSLLPPGALAVRIHARSGGGGLAMGRALALAAAELLGMAVEATACRGAERKGGPTVLRLVLAREPIRASGDPRHADVVLVMDPDALGSEEPLGGLVPGGVLVVDGEFAERWPAPVRQAVRARSLKVFAVDATRLAAEAPPDAGPRAPLRAAAFLGAFFRVAPLTAPAPEPAQLPRVLRGQLAARRPGLGEPVIDAILRAVERGHAEVRPLDVAALTSGAEAPGALPERPAALEVPRARPGPAHPGRFWEQIGALHASGHEGIADPFAALGVVPAMASTIRDLTTQRTEVPDFVPARCTGCGQCWTQCPDAAILGLATPVEDVIAAAVRLVGERRPAARLQPLVKHVGAEARRLLREGPFTTFGEVVGRAYAAVADRLDHAPDRRQAMDAEFAGVAAALEGFPLARTGALFERPEARARGTGALLSVAVNPGACKGCGLCVAVCPEGALRTVPQTPAIVDRLRAHWRLWQRLPETADAHVEAASADEQVGPLPALLLKRAHALSMAGGDLACPGCGEKTALHLVLAAIHARLRPRVAAHVARLDELIARLDGKARALLASDADLQRLATGETGTVGVPLEGAKKAHVDRIARILAAVQDLRERYGEGPGGRGRAACGVANAMGCSSVWGSYPLNPYPFPWVHQLDHDAPAVAIGLLEGHMRKMVAGFAAVRRAELELADEYEPATHDPALDSLTWRDLTDDELRLCPPILAVGGDGALLDGGLGDLSRVLASGRPVRVVVLDTQGASSVGGQPTRAGFLGRDGLATAGGPPPPRPARQELALLAIAHRGAFVLQSSQAAPAHLLAGVLRGLDARGPAVFHLLSPCPAEHGTAHDQAWRAARLALESRAFPLLVYDPAAGVGMAGRLSLDGNPAPDRTWPTYRLAYVDAGGAEQSMELPLTVADWAATEGRFRAHLSPLPAGDPGEGLVPFHEYLDLAPADREGKVPFVHALGAGRRLERLVVGAPIVQLAEERREVWATLRDLAGLKPPDVLALEAEFERRLLAVRAEYETKLADLRARYPKLVARRLAEALLRAGGPPGLGEILAAPATVDGGAAGPAPAAAPVAAAAPTATATAIVEPAAAPPGLTPAAGPPEREAPLSMEAYIDTPLCTACNECTNLNRRMFAYNAAKQAYIKDPRAGTFQQLVRAAEKCPVRIIHPGTPLDPTEKDLDKWIVRAKPFN